MRKCLTTTVSFGALLALSLQVLAIAPEATADRFAAIPERNLFGLKPAPEPPVDAPPPPNLPKILLTGITTVLGNKRALMKTQPPAGSPPGAKEQSLILTEGQREGPIEVLNIDEHAGSVKVDNSGTLMTLTFEKDGPKLPTTPPSAAPATPPGLPAVVPAAGGFGVPATNTAVPTNFTPPTRNPRGLPVPGTAGNTPTPTIQPGGTLSPTGGPPLPPASLPPLPGQQQQPQQPAGLTAEEQAIIQQLQNETATHNAAVAPQTAPAPGTPQAGVTTVVPPGFKTPSTVPPGGSPGRALPQ